MRLYDAGEYLRARGIFHAAATLAESEGAMRRAAVDWNDAGAMALARLDYRNALPDFLKAKAIGERHRENGPLVMALGNLAALNLQMGDYRVARQMAEESLTASLGTTDVAVLAKARFQLATALARANRFDEAEPVYRQAIDEIEEQGDFESISRLLGNFGIECLTAGRNEEAEAVLAESLWLARLHRLNTAANALRALGRLRDRQGDARSAKALFDAAIMAPAGVTPRWLVYVDRGEFRLGQNDLRGAMADFREARHIAARMRADIVPADQDRVALESGLNRIDAGLIEAGNRLANKTGDAALVRETFDAAEQDRRWSLRALDPDVNDWRSHLPDSYWDLLARYQAVERSIIAKSNPQAERRAFSLQRELEQLEATAGKAGQGDGVEADRSALAHAGRVLAPGTVLLSFHLGPATGWLWAVDRSGVEVYPMPPTAVLAEAVKEFAAAARTGEERTIPLGRRLYDLLFGAVSTRFLSSKNWLLELDGPLFDLPFAALPAGNQKNRPIFLFERAVLETIPGALMLERNTPFAGGDFLGVGDAIYNAADERYAGKRGNADVVLPRLAATGTELSACARAWNPARARILTGAEAAIEPVRAALRSNPAVVHFATHVVQGPENHASGLIALSLDPSGAMGFLGPKEIVAHTVSPALIVLNGCHSAQGDALPGTGLMGLTRAWIGAGAHAVIATRWDIPDEAGAALMVGFYGFLRAEPAKGPAYALQQAQVKYLENEVSKGNVPVKALAVNAAYFLLGRG
jgi:tetratricopeptide (TPR) repeat protein